MAHKSHTEKKSLRFRGRNFLLSFLTKKCIERFGEGLSLGVWPHPHERALQRSTSRVGHWPRGSEINGIIVNTFLKYPMEHVPFMLEASVQYIRTLEKPGAGSIAFLFSKAKAGGEGGDRGWDGCTASLTPWTRVWANSRREWMTGKPDVLQPMGS